MKNMIPKNLLVFISVVMLACCVTVTAFAATSRWLSGDELKDSSAEINSWIKVRAASADAFAADEDYIVTFTVKQWAENGNYKLVLSDVDFFDESGNRELDPDHMWQFLEGGVWKPVSQAENLQLIPLVTVNSYAAELQMRVNPDFFLQDGFAPYLDYSLELTARLQKI